MFKVNTQSKDIIVNGFDPKRKELGFIHSLLSEDLIQKNNDELIIPFEVFYSLSNEERSALGFPETKKIQLKIRSNVAFRLPNFKLDYVLTENGKKLSSFEFEDEIFLKIDGTPYTLPGNLSKCINLLDKHNSLDGIKEKNQKSELFHDLSRLLPIEVKEQDERLKTIRINYADKFTLSFNQRDMQVHPNLISGETNEFLLNPSNAKNFKEEFEKAPNARNYYILGHNNFVYLTDRLKKSLEVVKNVQKETPMQRATFFYNPTARFENEIIKEKLTESEYDLFVETEHYLSERIEKLGTWSPKNYSFEPGSQNDWLPKGSVIFINGENLVHLKEDEIEEVLKKLITAEKDGKEEITHNGEKIKVGPQIIDDLGKFIERRKEGKKNDPSNEPIINEPPSEGGQSHPELTAKPLVPIIYDNVEGDFYLKDLTQRKGLLKEFSNNLLTFSLKEHQKECFNWLQEAYICGKRGVLLADDMGLGKTFQTLAFLTWLTHEIKANRTGKGPYLIIGPTALLKNWAEEHQKAVKAPGIGSLFEAYGTSLNNIKSFGSNRAIKKLKESDWVLTTYESMKNNQDLFRMVNWKVLVFDEIQKIKNPNSFVTEMAKALESDFTIGLTGTPVENTLLDLWCVSDAIWAGILGPYKFFKSEYQGQDADLEELKHSLTKKDPPPFMLRRLKKDELPGLPKKVEIRKSEFMENLQLKTYSDILKKAQNGEYEGNPFAVVHELRRVSLGFFNLEMSYDEVIKNSARLRATLSILDEIKDRSEKVLIFVESRDFQKILIPLLTERYSLSNTPLLINGKTPTATRQKYVNQFQEDISGFNIMLISPEAGGTGFTLTNANNVIHIERMWNPAKEDQASDRVYRMGQDKNVNIYIPMAKHPELEAASFDYVLDGLLTRKRELSRQVIVPTGLTLEDKKGFLKGVANISGDNVAIGEDFYRSPEWKQLRAQFIASNSKICSSCEKDLTHTRNELQVDHIKPRSKYPELALDWENLQVMCSRCNASKGARIDLTMDEFANDLLPEDEEDESDTFLDTRFTTAPMRLLGDTVELPNGDITCERKKECPLSYYNMDIISEKDSYRECSSCNKKVFKVSTQEEAKDHAKKNHCIAFVLKEYE